MNTSTPNDEERRTMTENTTQSNMHDAEAIRRDWATNARWSGIARDYEPEDVVKLRGSLIEEHTLARHGAERLWDLINTEDYVNALGALTGNQAVEQVKAGRKAIYLSGWQVAADANAAGQIYPDQSIYPANSVPQVVRGSNDPLTRADRLPGRRAGQRRAQGHLPLRPAGRRRRQRRRPDLPGPADLPGQRGAAGRASDQQRAHARRPGRDLRGADERRRLVRPDRRRRRGGLRRHAERLRAHALDDRLRCGRRPLRGPARLREEVRPPRRQGPGSDLAAHPHPERGPAGCR